MGPKSKRLALFEMVAEQAVRDEVAQSLLNWRVDDGWCGHPEATPVRPDHGTWMCPRATHERNPS